jgi:hypothetical protein
MKYMHKIEQMNEFVKKQLKTQIEEPTKINMYQRQNKIFRLLYAMHGVVFETTWEHLTEFIQDQTREIFQKDGRK